MIANGYGVSLGDNEKVLKVVSGDGCAILNTTESHTLKKVKMVNFMFCEFYLN